MTTGGWGSRNQNYGHGEVWGNHSGPASTQRDQWGVQGNQWSDKGGEWDPRGGAMPSVGSGHQVPGPFRGFIQSKWGLSAALAIILVIALGVGGWAFSRGNDSDDGDVDLKRISNEFLAISNIDDYITFMRDHQDYGFFVKAEEWYNQSDSHGEITDAHGDFFDVDYTAGSVRQISNVSKLIKSDFSNLVDYCGGKGVADTNLADIVYDLVGFSGVFENSANNNADVLRSMRRVDVVDSSGEYAGYIQFSNVDLLYEGGMYDEYRSDLGHGLKISKYGKTDRHPGCVEWE